MMKKFAKIIFSPKGTLAVFVAAVALLMFSSIGGARAALTFYSENHMTELQTQSIDVALVENGVENPEALLTSLVEEGEKLKVGVEYGEELAVKNTGQIDQYVRVTIYKSWVNKDGKKRDVYPGYIKLDLKLDEGWAVDESASTQERTVLYYTKPLAPGESVIFADKLSINPEAASIITKNADGGIKYAYQGLEASLDVDVDAVQTHNAADAILSAWGLQVDKGRAATDENGVIGSLDFSW